MLTQVRETDATEEAPAPRRPRRRRWWVVAVLLLVLLAVAVLLETGDRSGDSGSGSRVGGLPASSPDRPAKPDDAGAAGDMVPERSVAPPYDPDAVAGDPGTASAEPGTAPTDPSTVPLGGVERSLVRTAQLSIEADDPVGLARRARGLVAAAGGSVVAEDSYPGGSRFVVRVPVDRLDVLADDLAALGTPTARSSQVVDATEQVVDLDARVRSQQASVERVRALLARAESIGEIVSVESELTRREADLDSLTGRLAALRDQVELSTLTVDVSEPGEPAPVPAEPAPGFLGGLGAGWAGLQALGAVAGAVLGFVVPFLPLVALLVGGVLLVRRRRSGPGTEGES